MPNPAHKAVHWNALPLMHITAVDNVPDLLRKAVLFITPPRELRQADNMKPKSLPLRLFDRNPAAAETLNMRAAKYRRHVDCADHREGPHHSGHSDGQPAADNSGQNEKCHREIHFAFLSERYEPLIDDEAQVKAKEEKKKRKKEKYKKVKKVGDFLEMLIFNAYFAYTVCVCIYSYGTLVVIVVSLWLS